MSRNARIISISIIMILTIITFSRHNNRGDINNNITNNALVIILMFGLIGLNYIFNRELLQHPLKFVNELFSYPRYKLVICGAATIIALALIDNSFDKLMACFAIASICLGRDHRWAAFGALDMLAIVVVMLVINQQTLADIVAVYLYYFLVVATLTMIINPTTSQDHILVKE